MGINISTIKIFQIQFFITLLVFYKPCGSIIMIMLILMVVVVFVVAIVVVTVVMVILAAALVVFSNREKIIRKWQ